MFVRVSYILFIFIRGWGFNWVINKYNLAELLTCLYFLHKNMGSLVMYQSNTVEIDHFRM